MATYLTWTGGASTVSEVLIREDVSSLLSNLFPLDTQLQAWCDKVAMTQIMIESPIDTYGGGNAISRASTAYTGGDLVREEGFTPTAGNAQYPTRLRAIAEIHVESFSVSGTDRSVDQYAIKDRYTLEALKMTRKVVNDFEMDFWWGMGTGPSGIVHNAFDNSALGTPIGGAGNYRRVTQGVVPWVSRTGLTRTKNAAAAVFNAHGESIPAAFNTWCYDANNVTLDRSMFEFSLMSPWWDIGGEPDGCVIFCSPKVKSLFTTFALTANGPINERKVDAADKIVIDTVDAYETQFGIHYVNKSRYLNVNSTVALKYSTGAAQTTLTTAMDEVMIALMPRYYKIGVFRGVAFSPLAKVGDLDSGMISGEQAMMCLNPIGGAGIVNCVA